MANSKIYFTPDHYFPHDKLRTIDFGERLSDLQITPYREVSDSVSMGGKFSRVARRSGMRVRIVLERFTDDTLAEQFYSLQSHLEAGGVFSFTVDDSKKFAAFVKATGYIDGHPPAADESPGFNEITHEARLMSEYGAHGLAANDVLHVESFGAAGRREEVQVEAYNKPEIDLKTGLLYNHRARGVSFVRHRDFFPFLVWPQGQMGSSLITSDHRISYTVDFTCEVFNGNLLNAYGQQGENGSGLPDQSGGSSTGNQLSIDELFGMEGPAVDTTKIEDKISELASTISKGGF